MLRHAAIDVTPPRAGPCSAVAVMARRIRIRPPGDAPLALCLAGLIPGLGHLLAGVPWGAAAVALAQTALIVQAVLFAGTGWGHVVLALMTYHHAFSMYDLRRRAFGGLGLRDRARAMGLFLAGTLILYLPLYVAALRPNGV